MKVVICFLVLIGCMVVGGTLYDQHVKGKEMEYVAAMESVVERNVVRSNELMRMALGFGMVADHMMTSFERQRNFSGASDLVCQSARKQLDVLEAMFAESSPVHLEYRWRDDESKCRYLAAYHKNRMLLESLEDSRRSVRLVVQCLAEETPVG